MQESAVLRELWLSRGRGRVMWKSIVAIDFNCGKYAKDLDTTETLRQNCVDVSIRDGRGLRRGTIVLTVIVLTVHDRGRLKMRNGFGGVLGRQTRLLTG